MHHAVARAGALAAGVPAAIVEFLARFVWPAPRYCVVHGAAPARPVCACTGLPAGDPCSPSLLAYVLAPWRSLVESCPGIRAFLFMDDRSLVDLVGRRCSEDALASALALSQWADETLGLQEHQGKRQLWDRTANPAASVEHLGITTAPGSSVFPELRVAELQLCSLASAVTCLPGGMAVSERLLQGLVLPKLLWSAPLTPKLSPAVTEAFYRAIRGPCTWWCKGYTSSRVCRGFPLFRGHPETSGCWELGTAVSGMSSCCTPSVASLAGFTPRCFTSAAARRSGPGGACGASCRHGTTKTTRIFCSRW